jgi:probable F420-dependent oxidoreductase
MRFSIQLPTDKVQYGAEFASAAGIAEMARAAEAAGYWACNVTDHPFPTERWMRAGGHHALDPFVALSFAAAATSRLRLMTNILVLPYRNPFLAARSVATLDSLSQGRVVLGAALGYLKGEFKALGVDFEKRNELADEALRAMKAAWTQAVVEFEGDGFTALGNVLEPKPAQKPHPPIWIGGNAQRAIRRAVDFGDGWIPFSTPAQLSSTTRTAPLESLDDLRARIDYLRDYAAKVGRKTPLDIAFTPALSHDPGRPDAQRTVDQIGRLRELGVTCFMMGVPAKTRAEFCDGARRYAQEVIAKLA